MSAMRHLHALVMAGGSGTRFWPASRKARPKQLLPLAPGSSDSLLAGTIRRILPLCPPEDIVVVTGEPLLDATQHAVAEFPGVAVIAEPVARNTAPCIGWGTSLIARRDPDAVVMVFPSDHHVKNAEAFQEAALRAARSAADGPITTIGLAPTRPETGYGHIEAVEEVAPGVRRVLSFVEKPDRARAEEYAKSGRHFWNSGMFFFRASVMLEAIAAHLPELGSGLSRIESAARRSPDAELAETRAVFPGLPSISIDYGIMEKVSPIHVVPAEFGWSDLGSWAVAWELGSGDRSGNVVEPTTVLFDSANNLVRDLRTSSDGRVIALVGVHDLCVVETDDALLVMPRDRAQDVRKIVEELERRGQRERL